jgi:hypothetical protein
MSTRGLTKENAERIKKIQKKDKEKTVKTKQDKKAKEEQSKRVDDQCFLIKKSDSIIDQIAILRRDDYRYEMKNLIQVDSEPSEIINLITPKKVEPFLEMTPAQRALLQPYIRFFKVIKNEKMETIGSTEFPLKIFSAAGELIHTGDNQATALERINKSGLGRIPDIGVKSFSFSKTGGWEQAHVPNTITAKLQLYCNTIDALLLNFAEKGNDGKINYPFGRTGQNPVPPPILDLVNYSDRVRNSEKFQCMEIVSNFKDVRKMEIHAHVGWSIPQGGELLFGENWKDFQNAVKKSRAVLILTLVKSNIQLQSNGSIIVEGE